MSFLFIGRCYSGISRRAVNTNGVQGTMGLRERIREQYRGRLRRIPQDRREGTRGPE